jgi:hypothetical protein
VECYQHFRGNCDLQLQSRSALNLESLCFSAIVHETTLHDNPEDHSLMENNLCTFISLCIGCRIFSFTLSVYSSVLQLNSGVKEELISISETGLSREELVFCVMWSHIIVALRVCCRSVWVCGPIRHS